jgi:hypothetical protein
VHDLVLVVVFVVVMVAVDVAYLLVVKKVPKAVVSFVGVMVEEDVVRYPNVNAQEKITFVFVPSIFHLVASTSLLKAFLFVSMFTQLTGQCLIETTKRSTMNLMCI